MKTEITIGEKYAPAMEITDQGKADEYFEICVRHNLTCRAAEGRTQDVDEAMKVERSNLGYFAGYYGPETRERVERLFKCSHPVFGSITENGSPTDKEALAAGMVAAKSGIKTAAKIFAV